MTIASRDTSVKLLKQVLPRYSVEGLHFLKGLIQGHSELGLEIRIPASEFNFFILSFHCYWINLVLRAA